MSIASRYVVPENMRTSIIRVYSYDGKAMQGTFYNPYYGEEIVFTSLTRLLLLMEDMMDEMDSPRASTISRKFIAKPKKLERQTIAAELHLPLACKALATFHVKVMFRQSASWQGKLWWIEGEQDATFRSALEFIKLMDNVLPQPEGAEEPAQTCARTTG